MRPLAPDEVTLAEHYFGRHLRTAPVRLTRDHPMSLHAPKTLGNTVHLKSGWHHFDGPGLALSPRGLGCLVHELVHVWQYQNGGLGYVFGSLWAQLHAIVTAGDRGGAYRWRPVHRAGVPWARWNPEQQAQVIEDHFKASRRIRAGAERPKDQALVEGTAQYLDKLRAGQGAARLFG